MKLKEQRSIRAIRSTQPFTGTSVSKSLRGMRSLGALGSRKPKLQDVAIDVRGDSNKSRKKTKVQDVAIDIRRDNNNKNNNSNSNTNEEESSIGSIEFSFDLDLDMREPPSSPNLVRQRNFIKQKKSSTKNVSRPVTSSRQSQEKKDAKNTKTSTSSQKNSQAVAYTEANLHGKKSTERAREVKSPENDSQRVAYTEGSPDEKSSSDEIKPRVNWDEQTIKSAHERESATNDSQTPTTALPIHDPVLASASAEAEANGEDSSSENSLITDGVEKYYSKLEAAQQKHEEEREYLFRDIATVYSMDDSDTAFSAEEIGTSHSRMVDIDFVIEDEELKREVFGDDLSIQSMDTGFTEGERWGTGALDFALLLCV